MFVYIVPLDEDLVKSDRSEKESWGVSPLNRHHYTAIQIANKPSDFKLCK